jgi:hypothetical protein
MLVLCHVYIFSRKILAFNDASQRDKVIFIRQLELTLPPSWFKMIFMEEENDTQTCF